MHQPWRTFAALINRSLSGKTIGLDKLRLSRTQILWGMYHKKNMDYVELLWKDFIYQIDNRAYKKQEKMYTTLDSPTLCIHYIPYQDKDRATPPKKAQKFEKPASPQLTTVPVSLEEPTGKSKRVKRPAKKSTKASARKVKDEFVKTPSNYSDDEDETKTTNKAKGDEDEEMDYTTNQLYDDVDIRLNEPVDTDKGFIQEEGTNAEMTNIQQRNENLENSQVIEDAHVTLSTIPQKTEVPVTSSSHSSDLAAKFIKILDIPHTDAEIVSPMDVHYSPPSFHKTLPYFTPPPQQSISTPPPVTKATNPQSALLDFASVFQFNNRVTSLEKEVTDSKRDDPLKTQVTALVDEHLDARLGSTRDEFMNFLLVSLAERTIEQVKNQPPQILPKERSRKYKDKDEDPSAESDQGLKKRKTSKDAEPTKGPKAKESQSSSSKGTKSQPKSSGKSVQSEEPEKRLHLNVTVHQTYTTSEPTNPNWKVGITPQQGQNQSWLMTLASSADKPSKTFDELMSTPIVFSAYIMNGMKSPI
ncbi:hypothetical protein Tco_0928974 [Tanacetum coccineum]